MSPQQPDFGTRLRALRTGLGLSQQQLAGTGMSTGYLSRLESGARPPTARAAEYLAERLGVPLATLRGSHSDPLAQALALATATEDPARARTLLDQALTTHPDGEPALRWQALRMLAALQQSAGDRTAEAATLAELTTLAEQLGAPELAAHSHLQLARCRRALGQAAEAHASATTAFTLATEHQLPAGELHGALLVLVSTETALGRLAEARLHADELELRTAEAAATPRAEALWTSAHVRLRQGDHPGAADRLDQALALLDSRENPLLWLRLRLAAASLSLQMSPRRPAEAERCLAEAAPAVELIGAEVHRQEHTLLRARLAVQQGRTAEAVQLCGQLHDDGLLLARQDVLTLRTVRGQLDILAGHREAGVAALEELAAEAHLAGGDVNTSMEIWRSLAETLART
ncbi:helix-turn-helix domain-containing protein [Kitasatospora sp. NPDC002227]|uniref:helix-turn-helix domain-containing protein n=1 Tax=Kitasatospora sp. NPDC002227 TaxID=3154773 RepID=UPI00332A69B6